MLTTIVMAESTQPRPGVLYLIGEGIGLLLVVGFFGWLLFRTLKRSEDPRLLLLKWAITAVVMAVVVFYLIPMINRSIEQQNYFMAIVDVAAMAVVGLVMTVIWRQNIAALIARPFAGLYDGGSQEIDLKPLYSIAQAKRKRGHYSEAIDEIRNQLEKFPDDFEGQFMIAEIQAENMNDLPGAELTIQRICEQAGHSERSIAYALNSLADWHLKYDQDRDAVRRDLEKIIELFPDSEMSAIAAQRIAHLASPEQMLAPHDRKRIAVRPGIENVGLIPKEQQPKAPDVDPGKQAAEYVRHLQDHPLDTDAREKLALLYSDHYGRLDLAAQQLEEMISHPGQPEKRVVRWLNLLAEMQIVHGRDYETVRQTVQRIIDRYPNSAAAQAARSRLDHLRLEVKRKDKSQTVKLGSYEQDIGLNDRKLPHEL